MNTLLEKISSINDMILQGKALEAFDQFYHDDIVMQENDNPIVEGKEANRKREEDFFGAITEFRGAQPLKVSVGENTTMVEWHFDYTHKDWGVKNYTQVGCARLERRKNNKRKILLRSIIQNNNYKNEKYN